MQHRKALMVINRRARRGGEDLARLDQHLLKYGIDATRLDANDPGSLDRIARAGDGGYDLVILGGGDGSINKALPGLLASALPLGILPLGTGNDLARTLGIPLDLDQACRIIAEGRIHRIDLGEVNGSAYVNVASMGVSVAITRRLNPETKKAFGPFAYAVSAWRGLRDSRPFRARITCDGKSVLVRSVQIAIGNGRHYGGGMTVDENATLDDSLLHLYSLAPRPLWHYVLLAPSLRSGKHRHSPAVMTLSGRTIRIETNRRLAINTDGEVATATPAEFRVEPARLPVFVPSHHVTRRATEAGHVAR